MTAMSIISRSARGSANFPKSDSTFQRRASHPSTWSVIPATPKTIPAGQLASPAACTTRTTNTGMSARRRMVSAFGSCASGAGTARVAMGANGSLARMPNRLPLPGFVTAHSHAFQRALRGRAQGDDFWGWREAMLALAEALTPESVRMSYEAAYREMRAAGYTAVGEFHYVGLAEAKAAIEA